MAESPETPASPAAHAAPATHAAQATPGAPATRAPHAAREAPASGGRVAHIGLVGLGRVGRNLFRLLHDSADLRLEAVSDPAPPAPPAYPPRLATPLRRFPAPSRGDGDVLPLLRSPEGQGRHGGQARQ